MSRKCGIVIALTILFNLPLSSKACMEHYGYGFGNNHGMFSYSNRVSNLSKSQSDIKIFKLNHPSAAVAEVSKEESFEIDYEVPADSKNVKLTFSSTNNITMIDQVFDLKENNGKVIARFFALEKGINSISVTIAGELGGKQLSYTSELYIKSKSAS